ncbi:MAG: N-acetylmuramoyl-L-alanine amidase [Bacteroidaceae bacterium]|nr:N-acetylmuramoyl-L-alanine amidase [Bacteroidaceae bacterium]
MYSRNLHIRLLLLLLVLLVSAPAIMAQKNRKKQFTVVIDPGHGGIDPGALGKRAKEKDVNMSVSKLLADMIKKKYPGIKVIFTRTTDVKIPLAKRADIANNANADLFISIHSNASKNRKANGCETFTLGAGSSAEAKAAAMYENEVILQEENHEELYNFDPRSTESYIMFELIRGHDMELSVGLAEMVQKGMVKHSKLKNRGVSSAGFLVLHRTVMPSILVELGFITNGSDENVIASKEGQKKLAKGIFEGFCNYYETYCKGNSTPVASSADNNEESKSDAAYSSDSRPVFKVQILASDKKLKKNDKRLKGVKADFYVEKGKYKYTYGESTDYNAIVKKRKDISKKFKEAFIIAFIDGERVDTQEAIKIFKKNNK